MKKFAALALGTALLACSNVMAEGMYFEVDYMKLDMELKLPASEVDFSGVDASPPAIDLKIGSQFNPYFAVEGMLGLGLTDDDFLSAEGNSFTGELKSIIGVNALGTIPVRDNFKIYGKVGYAQVDVEIGFNSGGFSDTQSYDDTGVLFGAGLVVDVTEKSALAIEYIRLPDVDVEEAGSELGSIKTSSINIGYRGSF